MSYLDCITIAAQHVQDWDLPTELMPLIIANEAARLSGHEAGHMGNSAWD